jgi:hypothetical protein
MDSDAVALPARLYVRIREGVFNEIATGEVHGHFPAPTAAGAPGKTNWQIPTLEIARLLAEALRTALASDRQARIDAGHDIKGIAAVYRALVDSILEDREVLR